MSKRPKVDRDARLVYVLLRYDVDLDQADFADLTQTSPGQVSLYDRGERTVPEAILERAAESIGFPPNLLRPARRAVRSFRAAARGWSRPDRVLAETVSTELLACAGEALEVILSAGAEPRKRVAAVPGPRDREAAAELWQRLERRNARQRLAVVEELEEYQTWALCELVCAKSLEMAPVSPAQALELAELALRIAELCPGDPGLFDEALILALEASVYGEASAGL